MNFSDPNLETPKKKRKKPKSSKLNSKFEQREQQIPHTWQISDDTSNRETTTKKEIPKIYSLQLYAEVPPQNLGSLEEEIYSLSLSTFSLRKWGSLRFDR